MRVLVANEPRAYRAVLATVLRSLRPGAEVVDAEPEALDREVGRLAPDLVICSRATGAVREVPSWVELYPDGENEAVVSVLGRRSRVPAPDLACVLAAVDDTERLL